MEYTVELSSSKIKAQTRGLTVVDIMEPTFCNGETIKEIVGNRVPRDKKVTVCLEYPNKMKMGIVDEVGVNEFKNMLKSKIKDTLLKLNCTEAIVRLRNKADLVFADAIIEINNEHRIEMEAINAAEASLYDEVITVNDKVSLRCLLEKRVHTNGAISQDDYRHILRNCNRVYIENEYGKMFKGRDTRNKLDNLMLEYSDILINIVEPVENKKKESKPKKESPIIQRAEQCGLTIINLEV